MLIYKIWNEVNDKLYIGQTTKTLKERIQNHKNSMVSNVPTHIYNAMRKYGWDKFHFEVIEYCNSQDELDAKEEYWIRYYDSVNNGYNMSYGGSINVMYSEDVAKHHKEVMQSKEIRSKIGKSISEYRKTHPLTESQIKSLSNSKKEFYKTKEGDEAREKFKEHFVMSESHKEAANRAKFKSVYCIDRNGAIIQKFESVKEASSWWYHNGYDSVKDEYLLCDMIKKFAKEDKFIRNIKWIYVNGGERDAKLQSAGADSAICDVV